MTGQSIAGPDPAELSGNAAASQKPGVGALDFEAAEEQRALYTDGLYRALGQLANAPLPDRTILHMLGHLPEWQYTPDAVPSGTHFLTRQALDTSMKLELSTPQTPARSVHRDEKSLTIRVGGDQVRGRDLRTLIEIERQYPRTLRKREFIAMRSGNNVLSDAAIRFAACEGVYLHEDDLFTDEETVALSYTTHCRSAAKLAETLGVKAIKINELFKPLYERAGIKSNKSSPDPYIELMLIAISLGIANTDHIPKASEGELEDLTEADKQLMSQYYSANPQERTDIRQAGIDALTTRWSRLCKKLGIHDRHRHSAVLYAVKNGILQPPEASVTKERLART